MRDPQSDAGLQGHSDFAVKGVSGGGARRAVLPLGESGRQENWAVTPHFKLGHKLFSG